VKEPTNNSRPVIVKSIKNSFDGVTNNKGFIQQLNLYTNIRNTRNIVLYGSVSGKE
jgi:hypothetical protein